MNDRGTRETQAPKELITESIGFLSGNMIMALLGSIVAGLFLLAFTFLLQLSILIGLIVSALPSLFVFFYCGLLVVGRPPGYQFDFFRSLFGSNQLKKKKKKGWIRDI